MDHELVCGPTSHDGECCENGDDGTEPFQILREGCVRFLLPGICAASG